MYIDTAGTGMQAVRWGHVSGSERSWAFYFNSLSLKLLSDLVKSFLDTMHKTG